MSKTSEKLQATHEKVTENLNVFQRMAMVMKEVEYLQKDDNINFGRTNYKAMSEEKVTSTLRTAMLKFGLIMYPISYDAKLHVIQTDKGTHYLDELNSWYKIQSIDNKDDFVEVPSRGHGVDSQDKSCGKAMTSAFKYALLRSFMIPTGDDPDKISSDELDKKLGKTKKVEKKYTAEPQKASNVDIDVFTQIDDFVNMCKTVPDLDHLRFEYEGLHPTAKKDAKVQKAKEDAKNRLTN